MKKENRSIKIVLTANLIIFLLGISIIHSNSFAVITDPPPDPNEPKLVLNVEYSPTETVIYKRDGNVNNYPEISFVTLRLMQRNPDGTQSLYSGAAPFRFDIGCLWNFPDLAPFPFSTDHAFMLKKLDVTFGNYPYAPPRQAYRWHGFYYSLGISGITALEDILDGIGDEIGDGIDNPARSYGQSLLDIQISGGTNPVVIAVISWARNTKNQRLGCWVFNGTYNPPIPYANLPRINLPSKSSDGLFRIELNVNNVDLVREDPDGAIEAYRQSGQLREGNFSGYPGDFIVRGGTAPGTTTERTYNDIVRIQYDWQMNDTRSEPRQKCVDWMEVAVSDICAANLGGPNRDVFKCLWAVSTADNNNDDDDERSIAFVERASPYLAAFNTNSSWIRFNEGGPVRYGVVADKGRDAAIYYAALKCYAYLHGASVYDREVVSDNLYVGNTDLGHPVADRYIDYAGDSRERGSVAFDNSQPNIVQGYKNGLSGDGYHNDEFNRSFVTVFEGENADNSMLDIFYNGLCTPMSKEIYNADIAADFLLFPDYMSPDLPQSDVIPEIKLVCLYKPARAGWPSRIKPLGQIKWLLEKGLIYLEPKEVTHQLIPVNGQFWPHEFVFKIRPFSLGELTPAEKANALLCATAIEEDYHLCVFYRMKYNTLHTSLDDDGWYFGIVNQGPRS